jgi:hypothetical protein
VIEDVNEDGFADVLIITGVESTTSGSAASVLLGNGDGTLRPRIATPVGTGGRIVFASGDVDGDGKPDLVLSDVPYALSDVTLYAGNGDGSFHRVGDFAKLDGVAKWMRLSDVDGDGRLDVVVGRTPIPCAECEVYRGTTGVDVLRNNGDGTWQPAVPYTGALTDQVVADVTGDGKPDTVTKDATGVRVVPGNGDGSVQPMLSYPFPALGPVSVADIDRDGRLDIIAPGAPFAVLFARCVR